MAISPSDAAVALRSLPRRFREALEVEDEDPEDIAGRPGPQGHSALDHLTRANRTLALLHRATQQAVMEDEPVLHPAVTDRSAREWGAGGSLDTELAALTDEVNGFADGVEKAPSEAWERSASVAGGGSVTAIELLDDAVSSAVDELRAAEEVVRAVS